MDKRIRVWSTSLHDYRFNFKEVADDICKRIELCGDDVGGMITRGYERCVLPAYVSNSIWYDADGYVHVDDNRISLSDRSGDSRFDMDLQIDSDVEMMRNSEGIPVELKLNDTARQSYCRATQLTNFISFLSAQGYMSSTDFAYLLGISPQTLFNWKEKGLIAPVDLDASNKPLFCIEQVYAYYRGILFPYYEQLKAYEEAAGSAQDDSSRVWRPKQFIYKLNNEYSEDLPDEVAAKQPENGRVELSPIQYPVADFDELEVDDIDLDRAHYLTIKDMTEFVSSIYEDAKVSYKTMMRWMQGSGTEDGAELSVIGVELAPDFSTLDGVHYYHISRYDEFRDMIRRHKLLNSGGLLMTSKVVIPNNSLQLDELTQSYIRLMACIKDSQIDDKDAYREGLKELYRLTQRVASEGDQGAIKRTLRDFNQAYKVLSMK